MQDLELERDRAQGAARGRFLNLTLAIDSLTGASPSGAVPVEHGANVHEPVRRRAIRRSARASQPLDDDVPRHAHGDRARAGNGPSTRLALLSVGASLSDEYDYTHTGVNARLARDFNNRNTTLSFGLALANDTINPVGGSPVPLAPMLGSGTRATSAATSRRTSRIS